MKLTKQSNLQSLNLTFGRSFTTIFGFDSTITRVMYRMFELFERELRSNGPEQTIARFKFMETLLIQRILETPLPKHKYWISLDKRGFPKKLEIPARKLSPKEKQAILTIASYYRYFTLDVKPEIDTIVSPQTCSPPYDLYMELREHAERFYTKYKIAPFTESEELPIYGTTKAGPNGPKALGVSSLIDLVVLGETGLASRIIDLIEAVYTSASVDKFFEILDRSSEHIDESIQEKATSGNEGRLHFIAEPAGKTRVVAIPSILHQSACKPIHKYLMDCLKVIPNDLTYKQDSVSSIKRITKNFGLFCYDLTAATDRLPLDLQVEVLRPLLGDKVDKWADLIRETSFTYKDQRVKYSVGQPMGLLSSWPAMALTHHVIIDYCVEGLGESFYTVLGDDMTILSKKGSERYLDIMKRLGVEISIDKSFIPLNDKSERSTKLRSAEFAKRIFQDGHEISRIPPGVLIKGLQSLTNFVELLTVLSNRTNHDSASETSIGNHFYELWCQSKFTKDPVALSYLTAPLCSTQFVTKGWQQFQARLMEQSVTSYCWGGLSNQDLLGYYETFLNEEARRMISRWQRKLYGATSPSWFSDQMDGVSRLNSVTPTPILSEYLTYTGRKLTQGVNEVIEETHRNLTSLELQLKLLEQPDEFDTSQYMQKYQVERQRTMDRIHNFRIWLVKKGLIVVEEHDLEHLHGRNTLRRAVQ